MRCPRCRAKTWTYNHKLKFIGSSQKPHEVCDNQDADDEAKQQLSIHNEKYRQESHGTAGHALAIRLSIHISVGMQEEHQLQHMRARTTTCVCAGAVYAKPSAQSPIKAPVMDVTIHTPVVSSRADALESQMLRRDPEPATMPICGDHEHDYTAMAPALRQHTHQAHDDELSHKDCEEDLVLHEGARLLDTSWRLRGLQTSLSMDDFRGTQGHVVIYTVGSTALWCDHATSALIRCQLCRATASVSVTACAGR